MQEISYKHHNRKSGIYKISWLKSKYFYYGQSVDLFGRKRQHLSDLRNGKHSNRKLQSCFDKYGEPEITLVEFCSPSEMCDREQYYIDLGIQNRYCCNLSPSAHRVLISEEQKIRLSRLKSGSKLKESHKKNISVGLKRSYQTGQRKSFLANKPGELNPFYGRNHTDECRKVMSKKKQGMYLGGENPKAVGVIDTSTGMVFGTIKEAAEHKGISIKSLYKMLSGSRKNTTTFKRAS